MPAAPSASATTSRGPRIGIHTSIAGGVDQAAERAHEMGCGTLQIFSSSPRQWRASAPAAEAVKRLRELRRRWDLKPLVVHAGYLLNLAAADATLRERSQAAFREELERCRALGAEFLVLHPGAAPVEELAAGRAPALDRLAAALRAAARGFDWGRLRLLIEHTAGGGGRLGGSFAEVREILDRLDGPPAGLPAGACLDTCHCWAAGYELKSAAGYEETWRRAGRELGMGRIYLLHLNDAKCRLGSHLDRHQNIGAGELGAEFFRRLVNDPRLAKKAMILETPVDQPGDDRANVARVLSYRR